MFSRARWFVCLLILGSSTLQAADPPAPPPNVFLKMEIYRAKGNVAGDVSLTDDLWAGIDGPTAEAKKNLSFFTTAKLNLGGSLLSVKEGEWLLDGEEIPTDAKAKNAPANNGLIVISKPQLKCRPGKQVEFFVGVDQPFEYLVAKGNQLFEQKVTYCGVGLKVLVTTHKGPENRILLENLSIGSDLVNTRKPVEGTSLNVGEPIVSRKDYKTTINVAPNKSYGCMVHVEGEGVLLLKLCAEYMSPTSEPAKQVKQDAVK